MGIKTPKQSYAETRFGTAQENDHEPTGSAPEGERSNSGAPQLDVPTKDVPSATKSERAVPSRAPKPAKKEASAPQAVLTAPNYENAGAKITIQVGYPLPAPGICPRFDQIQSRYDERRANTAIIRDAWSLFIRDLRAGKVTGDIGDYQSTDKIMRTSRRITPEDLALARQLFDPLGVETNFSLGSILIKTALARYFASL